jgi:hypothetical protein
VQIVADLLEHDESKRPVLNHSIFNERRSTGARGFPTRGRPPIAKFLRIQLERISIASPVG